MFEADPEGRPVVKACLHESNKDEECGLEGRKQGICKKGLYPPLYCDNSLQKCKEAIVQTEKGKPCNKKGDDTQPIKICDASVGLTCVESSGTCRKVIFSEEGGECDKLDKDGNHLSCKEQSPPLYCDNFHQKCKEAIVQTEKGKPCNKKGDKTQPIKVCDASAGLTCIESSGTCRKVIISKEGGECDKLDEAGNHLSCGKGLICFDYRRNGVKDGWLTRCHIPCDKKNLDAECTTKNTKCRTYNDVDICIDSQCKIMEDCAFPGFQCLGGGGPRSTCYPLERSGTRKMGNICNAQYGCDTSKDPRAFCYTPTLQSKAGVCSSLCSDRLPCSIPGQDANGKAIYPQCLKSQDKSYCLFKCDGGYVCPINLTCQSSKFGDICLP